VIKTHFNLFLKDCSKLLVREDVNNQLIEFGEIHNGVIFNKFNVASLPANFTLVNKITKMGKDDAAINLKVTPKPNKEKIHPGKGKHKYGNEGKDKNGSKRKPLA
jgi:hypothetical protein